MDINFIIGPMRVPFLLLPPACVLLGVAAAYGEIGRIGILRACLALLGALAAHISVNALNEYVDCRSGLDARTQRTPFSGGSGTLPRRPAMAYVALVTGLAALAICVAIGIYFAVVCGPGIVPLAMVGVLTIVAYTPLLTRSPILCLIAPGLGFGLMTVGTHFVLTGRYSWPAIVASLVPFFLVSDLLLLNQFPDREPDKTVGRRHLLIVLGPRRSSLVYGGFLILAYVSVIAGVLAGVMPPLCLLGLLTAPLAVLAMRGAYRFGEDIPRLLPYLGLNVVLNLATPVLVAVGFFVKAG